MDGGTQGIFLLPWVCSAERLLILDAVDFGMVPATLKLVRGDDVLCFMGAKKVSMHQAGFQEVLASADLTGSLPAELALVGVQPFGGEGLSGTGPKAGGPHYLPQFATERVRTTDITATGGNLQLLSLGGTLRTSGAGETES